MKEVNITHTLKIAFLKLFPDAKPGNNGNIKYFSSFDEEYNSLTKGVAVRSLAGNVILKLTGSDVLDFINRISTNEVKSLGTFKQKNTLFINERGRLIDRTTLLKVGDYFFLVGSYDPNYKLKSWLDKYIIMEDIQLEDVTNQYVIFEFYGAQTNSFMTMLCDEKINDLDDKKITIGEADSIKTYITKLKVTNNISKYWAFVNSENAVAFIKYLKEHKSVFDFNFIGDKAFEYFRIRNGIPTAPNEINGKYNPYEINLIDEISFTKGCYIGQEVIARLDTYDKVQRILKGIKITLTNTFELPIKLYDEDGNEAGEITSLTKSKDGKNNIGLALIRKKSIENSDKTFVIFDRTKLKVTISNLPINE